MSEALGQDEVTDYLSVSFSSTDYVGHVFGPSSLESEENLLRLDRTLARLFEFVDEQVGLERTLVVLCADDGGPEAPEYLREFGLDADEVADVVAATLEREPGAFGDSRIARAVWINHSPSRSGDVYLVARPDHFVNDFDGLVVAATHGSPWRYDTYVPLIFLDAGIEHRIVQREVFTVDLAASLAALIGTKPPSGCEGEPLPELFGGK